MPFGWQVHLLGQPPGVPGPEPAAFQEPGSHMGEEGQFRCPRVHGSVVPGLDQVPVGDGEPVLEVVFGDGQPDLLEGRGAQLDQRAVPARQDRGVPEPVGVDPALNVPGDQGAELLVVEVQQFPHAGRHCLVGRDAAGPAELVDHPFVLFVVRGFQPVQRPCLGGVGAGRAGQRFDDEVRLGTPLPDPGQPTVRAQRGGVLNAQAGHLAPPGQLVIALLDGQDLLPCRAALRARQPLGDRGGHPVEAGLGDRQQAELLVVAVAVLELVRGDVGGEGCGLTQCRQGVHDRP
ncbi:hypothetical protein ACFY4C_37115 [Actinomadura viridis]|uniref:hypothetical protein n=1 Tax=Actinomadura viridis TaxID=58110 RepID=UPI0036C199A3